MSDENTDQLEKWLQACEEVIEGMMENAGPLEATRVALGALLINKGCKIMQSPTEPVLH